MSANFKIIETFDAYYVKVTGKVDLNVLSQELKRHQLDVDISKIMRDIVSAEIGQEILLLAKPPEPEDKIVLTIAPGKMSALLTLNIKPGEKIFLDEVFQKLNEKQIVHGVNLKRIKTLVKLKRPAFREVIAVGDSPKPGQDASITYTFNQPELNPIPIESGYSYEPGHIILIQQGEVLAQKTPSTLGVFGCNVLGEIVHPLPRMDLEFKVGQGVTVKHNAATAARDGALSWKGSEMKVIDVTIIPEDLLEVIYSNGQVLILGNVGAGAKIQAQDDVEIRGSVEGATVISLEGSVFVKGGIIGNGQSFIKAAGNVEAGFIEETTVEVGKNLIVDKYVYNSSITVDHAVYFKTIKEFTTPSKDTDKGNLAPSRPDQSYPKKVKQITKEMKTIEREMKITASKFKSLLEKEDTREFLQEQLARYSDLTNSLNQLRQERQTLINQCGSKGLGLLGLLVNVGAYFHVRYEQLLLEQPVKHATIFYDYHKKQVVLFGDQSTIEG